MFPGLLISCVCGWVNFPMTERAARLQICSCRSPCSAFRASCNFYTFAMRQKNKGLVIDERWRAETHHQSEELRPEGSTRVCGQEEEGGGLRLHQEPSSGSSVLASDFHGSSAALTLSTLIRNLHRHSTHWNKINWDFLFMFSMKYELIRIRSPVSRSGGNFKPAGFSVMCLTGFCGILSFIW